MSATCDAARDRLDDFVDGALEQGERESVEQHLRLCGDCRREELQLRALIAEAAALSAEVPPPSDLWPAIERRIRPAARGAWLRSLAAAACVALAVATALIARAPQPAGPAGASVTGGTAQPAAQEQADIEQFERDYARAASALLVQLRSRQGELPPETVANVEESLRTIDGALAQIRAALRAQPEEPALHLMLAATHRKKVEVLRRVVEVGA